MNREWTFRNEKNDWNVERHASSSTDFVWFCWIWWISNNFSSHVFHLSFNFSEFLWIPFGNSNTKNNHSEKKNKNVWRPQNFIIKCESNETEEIKFTDYVVQNENELNSVQPFSRGLITFLLKSANLVVIVFGYLFFVDRGIETFVIPKDNQP